MGEGKEKDEIAAGVINSVAVKVVALMQRKELMDTVIVTGGLSDNPFFAKLLIGKTSPGSSAHGERSVRRRLRRSDSGSREIRTLAGDFFNLQKFVIIDIINQDFL